MHVSYFSESNGLPSNKVRHVVQDTFGFLWIATDNGLVRFDGTDFQNYSQHIPSRYGRYFCPVDGGILLSHDAGISLIQPGLETTDISLFRGASIDPSENKLYYPDQIFQQSNGDIWITQPGGCVHRIKNGDDSLIRKPAFFEEKSKVNSLLCETNNGKLWLADSDGKIYLFDSVSSSFQKKTILPVINDMKSRGNELWIAGDHVYRIQLNEEGNRILNKETFYSDLGEVSTLAFDSKGNIFLGINEKGLFYLDRRLGRRPVFTKIFSNNDPHQVEELPFKNILKIVVHEDEKLWICSLEGLGLLQRRFFESLGSIPNANTNSISIAENGKIFVNFGDIYSIESNDFGFEGTALSTPMLGTVTALTTVANHLWAGTSTGMLFELAQDGRRLRSINLRERGEGIFYLSYDSKNRLWVCQAPEEKPIMGIGCILPDGSLKEYGINEGLQSRIVCLREAQQGRIYAVGHGKSTYLYRYIPEEEAFINLSVPFEFYVGPNFQIHDFTVDNNGIIWLASTDGLLRFDMDRISKVDLGPEFQNAEVRAVLNMSDGSIWISFDTEGILRYKDGEIMALTEESGLPSKVMTYRCIVSDNQSRLWVGTAEGIVYSLKDNPKPMESKSPLLLSIDVDSKNCSTENINLYRDQALRIKFNTPSFHGFRTFYQSKLNDGAWSDASTNNTFVFDKWSPGSYTISVRSKQEGGYLWSKPVNANVQVDEYWYKNKIYIWILGILLLASVFWFFRIRNQRYLKHISSLHHGLEQKKEEVEKQDAFLTKAKTEMKQEHRQRQADLLILEIMYRLISKIMPGMKWEVTLEVISIDLLKLPGVTAFEIGILTGDHIVFEGYSEKKKDYTDARVYYDTTTCLAAYCINASKAFIFNKLTEQNELLLKKREKRLSKHKSAISVPFYLNNKNAILTIYSDKEDLFDDYGLKALRVFAIYLEQIL